MTTVEPKDGDADRPPGSAWLSSHGETVSNVTEKEKEEKKEEKERRKSLTDLSIGVGSWLSISLLHS